MKIRFLLTLVGLAISFAVPIFAQQKDKVDPQLRETLIALVKKYDETFNKNDAAALAALFKEDAIFVTDTGPVNGRQAIEKYWGDQFKQFHPPPLPSPKPCTHIGSKGPPFHQSASTLRAWVPVPRFGFPGQSSL